MRPRPARRRAAPAPRDSTRRLPSRPGGRGTRGPATAARARVAATSRGPPPAPARPRGRRARSLRDELAVVALVLRLPQPHVALPQRRLAVAADRVVAVE